MTNDSKLGLLAGVVGVLMVAVVYFPKGTAEAAAPGEQAALTGTAIAPPAMTPTASGVPAVAVSRTAGR